MGCSTSKVDDEEAVQLCKDRKRFIKQAVEQRIRFATGHLAYIQSLKRVSAALRDYVEGDEPREFFLDPFVTHQPFTPVKKPFSSPRFISISPKSLSSVPIQSAPPSSTTTFKVNYLRSGGGGGNQAVLVEERPPQSPETFQVQSFSPVHQFGTDGFFAMQSPSMNSYSFFSSSSSPSNRNRAYIPPPSPRTTSQWDAFWNPFSSLDYYGYPTPTRSSLERMAMDDEIRGLRQVREEEGIPDLEDETEQEDVDNEVHIEEERVAKVHNTHIREEEVVVEDLDDTDSEEDETDSECECERGVQMLKSRGRAKIELSKVQNSSQVEAHNQEMAVGDGKAKDETPGFTVYVNRRPTSMAEVIKDLEEQFTVVCNSAKEISALLESSKAQYSSTNHELSAMKMLNPVALFRSASSRSSSRRFLMKSSSSRDEGYESSSDFSEESCMLSCSHQSTLDRLYAWEKKLYEEVKSGERVRIAYEKKRMQLRNHDVKGDDPSAVDKTRMALRDLDTRIKISLHSIEAISKRIETLRDEELHPQLLELVQGLGRMWRVMAECHQSQKRTLDEAKLLLAGMPSKLESRRHSSVSVSDPQRLARSAANLQTELRNWRACFESWITSQRSYVHSLKGWLLRCVRSDSSNTSKLPFSPRRSSGTHPIFGLCIQWSKFLDSVQEMPVLDGLDFFAAGMGSLYAQQLRDDSHRITVGARRLGAGLRNDFETNMEIIEVGEVEEVITVEKMAEVAIRVLCAGMSVAVSSLTEFALGSAEGYAEIFKQWENAKLPGVVPASLNVT